MDRAAFLLKYVLLIFVRNFEKAADRSAARKFYLKTIYNVAPLARSTNDVYLPMHSDGA